VPRRPQTRSRARPKKDAQMTKPPFVQRIHRADGRVDLYFRKGDYRQRLLSADASEELRMEVEKILGHLAGIGNAQKPKAGSVAGLLREFTRSAGFLGYAHSVQKDYQRLADEIEADMGAVLLREISKNWIRELMDAWAVRGYRATNLRYQVLKNALAPAIEDGRIKDDPFAGIKKVKRPHWLGEAHPIWEDGEVEAAIKWAMDRDQPGLARAIALGRWAGFRRQTICSIPLNARTTGFDDAGGPEVRLCWITEKRKVRADKREDIRLTALLNKTPNRALTIAYNADDIPWKERSLNQAVKRLVVSLAKEGKARISLDIHGLRHARGVELALSGASDAEIMSQLEHTTDRAAKIYRRQADRRKMADSAQTRVDTVVRIQRLRKSISE
jgi:hypothetical protein